MKKIFLFLIAMMIATVSLAQTSLLATLSHDGTISTYYGSTALKEALAKADDGDAITLSAGQFLASNINKAITLRGAGMSINSDSINSHESTIVQGEFDVDIADGTSNRLNIEGLYFTSKLTYNGTIRNALFMKCRFDEIRIGNNGGTLVNNSFIHCRISKQFSLNNNSNVCLINSVVWNPFNASYSASNFEFDNCVVSFTEYSSNWGYSESVVNSYYKNCIIMQNSSNSYFIPSSNVAYYCVGISNSSGAFDMFKNLASKNTTNKMIYNDGFPSIFKTHNSYGYNDSELFTLTETAKAKYIGTDSKQVGIYGGNLPYEEDPTTPQITKCNVAAKSTADGKLSVDIEVKAAGY